AVTRENTTRVEVHVSWLGDFIHLLVVLANPTHDLVPNRNNSSVNNGVNEELNRLGEDLFQAVPDLLNPVNCQLKRLLKAVNCRLSNSFNNPLDNVNDLREHVTQDVKNRHDNLINSPLNELRKSVNNCRSDLDTWDDNLINYPLKNGR